jgi:hypothetical protein
LQGAVPALSGTDVQLIDPDVRSGGAQVGSQAERELRIFAAIAEEGDGRVGQGMSPQMGNWLADMLVDLESGERFKNQQSGAHKSFLPLNEKRVVSGTRQSMADAERACAVRYSNRYSLCRVFRRFPQLYTIAFRVGDPAEFAILMSLDLLVDLHPFFTQRLQ